MPLPKYFVFFITAPLLIALTGRCSLAFSLTFNPNSSSSYNSSVDYDNQQCLVQTSVLEHIPPPEDDVNNPKDFMSILKNAFSSGWKFKKASNNLGGMLIF